MRARLGDGASVLGKDPRFRLLRRAGPYTLLAYAPTDGLGDS
jgi:hypothetical protein